MVDGTEVVWASALPLGTSAQRAKLIALTQALKKAEGKKANIYTDSRYALPQHMYMVRYTGGGAINI